MKNATPTFRLRRATQADRTALAELICVSTNTWYQRHGRPPVFPGGSATTAVFAEVYETLDPGCCIVAEELGSGRLIGSCFYHPRPTHISLGIMNTHPDCAGQGVASALLRFITDFADRERKPVRLISSALNLDSFSLYNRAGFVPRCVYQDMCLTVPSEGLSNLPPESARVRDATPHDVAAMMALEMEVAGICRDRDYRYFVENPAGFWHVSVLQGRGGGLDGWLVSCAHPGLKIIGPGVARDQTTALALLLRELDRLRGCSPLFLLPVECGHVVREMYARGARNCELHFTQVRGSWQPFRGVNLPTFLPETG
ncbi:MAG: GNAT family N-acetyltransferase [Verrucomicrobiae bacterium]|nr:GNAT family N-acetyltransferase [Verrucomicrobiae bacterium]